MRWTGSLLLLGLVTGQAFASVPQVKVLIGRSLKDVVVHGMDLKQTIPARKLYRQFSGNKTVNFNCRTSSRMNLPERSQLIASVTSPTGLVGWEQKRFRGELQLVAGPDAGSLGCDLVNLIPMEDYISSLLAKEMRADWPIEALKAQAVVARSYALAKMHPVPGGGPWHLESSEKNQVSGDFHDTTANTDRAAQLTAGEVLADSASRPVEGFFHSKCGGHTVRPDQVWSGSVDGYRGVECPFCHKHGKKSWQDQMSTVKFTELLNRAINRYGEKSVRLTPGALTMVTDSPTKTELRVYQGNDLHVVRKSWLRNIAGREVFPSHHFRVTSLGSTLKIAGEGFGHGVGMCQLGALELAKRGYSYRAILQHYFPDLKVKRLW